MKIECVIVLKEAVDFCGELVSSTTRKAIASGEDPFCFTVANNIIVIPHTDPEAPPPQTTVGRKGAVQWRGGGRAG